MMTQRICVAIALLNMICFVSPVWAVPYRTPVKPSKALIVEFGFLPRFGANAKMAHAATQAIAQELNRELEKVKTQINTGYSYADDMVFYCVENPPLSGPVTIDFTGCPSPTVKTLKFARQQAADAVIAGAVTQVRFVGDGSKKHPRYAEISLCLFATDALTGKYENGAIATGRSQSVIGKRETLNKDRMLSQAMLDAARCASKLMKSYALPKATILQCKGQSFVLNRGDRDGVCVNQRMMVRRGRKVIGEIRILKIGSDRAWGEMLPGAEPVNVGDEAKAIFPLIY